MLYDNMVFYSYKHFSNAESINLHRPNPPAVV